MRSIGSWGRGCLIVRGGRRGGGPGGGRGGVIDAVGERMWGGLEWACREGRWVECIAGELEEGCAGMGA